MEQRMAGTIALDRPEKLNAFSDELVVALNMMLRRFDADPEAFTAIIHGAGRAFSTGADVHQRQLRKREEFERLKVMALTPPTSCERLRHGAARTLDTRNLPIESRTTNADAMPPTSDIVEHTIGLVKAEAHKVGLWDGPTA